MVKTQAKRIAVGAGAAAALLMGTAVAPSAVASNVEDPPSISTQPAEETSVAPNAVPSAVVTLGDSFSSGLGSGDYVNDCDNTPNAWGNLIFGSAVTDRTMLACSGATIPTVEQQVNELAATPGSNRLITVTVGGNDVGFASELQECFLSNCTGREAAVSDRIDALVDPLVDIYEDIQAAAPDDELIVGGYPLLVPDPDERTWCTALTFLLTDAERDMIRRLGVELNDAIDEAASRAGVEAVTTDLEQRFDGHEACRNSSSDWIYGLKISFWSAAQDSLETMRADPEVQEHYVDPQAEVVAGWIRDSFHPTVNGQIAYADAFEVAYS